MPRTGDICEESGIYRCECRPCRKPAGQEPRVGLAAGTRFPPCSDCFGIALFTVVAKNADAFGEEHEPAPEERA